ncbi:MAG: hypothetical protein HLX51_11320 [Micrococcaceae bacterium]|nr:hypothetical protein [Micrococcaceae bacterium]
MKKSNQTDQAGNSPIPGNTTTTTRRYDSHGNHSKINGIKQTWHTIEFSNNHTHPTTTPQTQSHHQAVKTHDPQTTMNHTKHSAEHNTKPKQTTKSNSQVVTSITAFIAGKTTT